MRAPLRNVAVVEDPSPAEAPIMLPTEDLFVHVYVLVDDAIAAGEVTIPARPGPTPACSDAELLTRFGRDGAHGEWFYGFRLAVQADLGSRLVRAWSIVPAAVNERDVATDLLQVGPPPRDVLVDKGFAGRAFAAACAARGIAVLTPPTKAQRAGMPSMLRTVIASWRNYIEVTFGELTDRMELARHGSHTFWGLLTRTAATIAAHTLLRVHPADLGVA